MRSENLFSLLEECGNELELLCLTQVIEPSVDKKERQSIQSCRASLDCLEEKLAKRNHVLVSQVKSISQDLETLTQVFALESLECKEAMKMAQQKMEIMLPKPNRNKSFAIWRKYQDEGFQRHVRRQNQARDKEKRRKAASKRQSLEKRRKASRSSCRSTASSSPEIKPKAYLEQFASQKPRRGFVPEPVGVSVKVYAYTEICKTPSATSHAILTFSLADLKEKIKTQFQSSQVSNLYCSQTASRPLSLRHLRRWSQISNASCIVFTQTPRQDLSILCLWLTSRQTQQRQFRSAHLLASKSRKQFSPKNKLSHAESSAIAAVHVKNHEYPRSCAIYDYHGRNVRIQDRLL